MQKYIISSDGLNLIAEEMGQGLPLVFAHGLIGTRHNTLEQLAPLASHYRVVAFDQRGHGDSTPVTSSSQLDPMRMAEDFGAVMSGMNMQQAIVGGESMGAATALLFALHHPEQVDALLLTAPAFGDRPNSEREQIEQMGEAIIQMGMEAFLAQAAEHQRNKLGWPEEAINAVARNFRRHQPESVALACRTVPSWVILEDFAPLQAFDRPVCLIAWPGDNLHPLDLAQRMASTFPHSKLAVLNSVTEIFSQPRHVGEIYLDFLSELAR